MYINVLFSPSKQLVKKRITAQKRSSPPMVGGKSQSIEGKPSSNISNAEDEDPTFSGELYGKFTAGNG